jgi:hypothetical protein
MDTYLLLEYPYYNLYYKLNKKEIKLLIKNYKPIIYDNIPNNLIKYNLLKYDGKYFIIKENFLDTSIINNLTDYFSENIRIRCRFGNNISRYDYWKKNKRKILLKTEEKYNEINIYNIRETIYYSIKGCNNFRITVALTILRYFKAKKWLDISAGWGDRLLAGIFHNIKLYESTDPNLDLHPSYQNMINNFVTDSKKNRFIIHKNGFLEANIINNNFDIVFSSPPFFKLEKYSEYKEDSIKKYNDEDEWIDNFLVKSLIKCYYLLKKGGHLILYIGGSKKVMDKIFFLNKFMKFKGIIYFYEKSPKGMYVWKK